MRFLLCKRFRLLPYDVHPVHFAFHFNNTSHEPSCIRTYDFYQIHFSLHFQSVSECIPIPIPYHTVGPPKDLPDPCSLVCVPLCTYGLRRLTGRGTCTSNMYFQTIPPNSPRDLSCWKRNFPPPGIQKGLFRGVFELGPRRIFLGISGNQVYMHLLEPRVRCAHSDRRRCRHTLLLYLPT